MPELLRPGHLEQRPRGQRAAHQGEERADPSEADAARLVHPAISSRSTHTRPKQEEDLATAGVAEPYPATSITEVPEEAADGVVAPRTRRWLEESELAAMKEVMKLMVEVRATNRDWG